MASLKSWQTRASEHPLNLAFLQKGVQAGRFWAHPAPCLPYSLNDTNHSETTHDSISSGIMCSGCSLQTLHCLSELSRLKTARDRTWTYQAVPIGGMGCLCVECMLFDCADCFFWHHLKEIQQICLMWLSGNQIICKRCVSHLKFQTASSDLVICPLTFLLLSCITCCCLSYQIKT